MSKKKKQKETADVIIVGAGVAGCVLAFHLANAKLKVEVYERSSKEDMGHDWCDSVEKQAFTYANIPPPKGKEKKQDRDHLAIISPNLEKIVHLGYYDYWIVDRKLLQERLIQLAEKAGATFLFETEVIEPMGRGQWVVGVKKKNGQVDNARLIIDCSGNERILCRNIEILDLNLKLDKKDFAKAYRELHKVDPTEITGGKHKIENDAVYYRYGYEKGYSWLNFEDKNHLDIGAGVGSGFTDRKPKAIVNDYVNSNNKIEKEMTRGGGGNIIIRRPFTLVWYGFMAVGETAGQVIPTNGCGVGSSMIAAKIAAEVAVKALTRKEVSIDMLWEYQVRFTKERGRDLAALDMMRRHLQRLSEEELSFLIKKGIISKADFEKLIHGKYPKVSPFKLIISGIKGITKPKLIWKVGRVALMSNKIYRHYNRIPKKYKSREYIEWMLGQMHLFNKLTEKS